MAYVGRKESGAAGADPPEAIRVGRMLEGVGAVHFEEPCPFDHLEDTRLVADTLRIPVAGGEQEYSDWRFRWMVGNRGVDIVQPDLHYYGGMIRSVRVARMAALASMPTTVHISGGFGFVKDGRMSIPAGPGVGIADIAGLLKGAQEI